MVDDGHYGRLDPDGALRAVTFIRRFKAPPTEVWDALTDPVRLLAWLTETTIDPRPGGRVAFDFGEGGVCQGAILTFEPPSVLEYEWNFPDEHRSVVRWELRAENGGTVVTLVHRQLEDGTTTGYGAGWHAHLDQLAGHLARIDIDWVERYSALRPDYDERFGPRG